VTALRFHDVGFTYAGAAEPALAGVSLALAAGEGVAIFGPNGAGKTTLARLAMALLHPTRGSVETAGRPTAGLGPEAFAATVGFVFQNPDAQLFERTVRAELAFGPRQLGWTPERILARGAEVLEELGLASAATLHPYDLPLPTRRLVALASALMAEPVLLILDEPTAGLDRASRAIVERAVRARRAAGGAVLAVTHDAGFAAEALDRGVVLAGGRVMRDGPMTDVLGTEHAPSAPAAVELARGLGLTPKSLRQDDLADALVERCRSASVRVH
jgi:energy-coupling factor transporter ATP-binding protein EcfA2